ICPVYGPCNPKSVKSTIMSPPLLCLQFAMTVESARVAMPTRPGSKSAPIATDWAAAETCRNSIAATVNRRQGSRNGEAALETNARSWEWARSLRGHFGRLKPLGCRLCSEPGCEHGRALKEVVNFHGFVRVMAAIGVAHEQHGGRYARQCEGGGVVRGG